MNATNKGALAVAIMIVMILGIIIATPMKAGAVPIPLTQVDPFNDGSVLLNISADSWADGSWTFYYNVVNPGAPVFMISVGTADPVTIALYDVVDYDAPAPATVVRPADLTSLILYFFPYPGLPNNYPVPAGTGYDFSITYASFIDTQFISVRTGGSGATMTAKPNYSIGAAVPEPATLLLLGSGIISLGFLSRRKRRR